MNFTLNSVVRHFYNTNLNLCKFEEVQQTKNYFIYFQDKLLYNKILIRFISYLIAEEIKPNPEPSPAPSLVVISHPQPVHFTPQPVTIDLSKNSPLPLTLTNGKSVTIYSIDESQTSLNLSAESSGYVSNSTTSSLGNLSLNQSGVNGDDLEMEKSVSLLDQRLTAPMQSTFSALPMPPAISSGRRRTISTNSNR